MRRWPKLRSHLLVVLLMASAVVMLAGCHFHRYHRDYYLYDDLDYHPRYGSHQN